MEVIKETLWKRCLSTPTKPPAKNSNICLSETAYQHKGTRKKCKKTNQGAIIQWQRQCLMYKPHRKPRPKSKTSHISKHSPSPLHHTFLLGRARFTALPLSALGQKLQTPGKTLYALTNLLWTLPVKVATVEALLATIHPAKASAWIAKPRLKSFGKRWLRFARTAIPSVKFPAGLFVCF